MTYEKKLLEHKELGVATMLPKTCVDMLKDAAISCKNVKELSEKAKILDEVTDFCKAVAPYMYKTKEELARLNLMKKKAKEQKEKAERYRSSEWLLGDNED